MASTLVTPSLVIAMSPWPPSTDSLNRYPSQPLVDLHDRCLKVSALVSFCMLCSPSPSLDTHRYMDVVMERATRRPGLPDRLGAMIINSLVCMDVEMSMPLLQQLLSKRPSGNLSPGIMTDLMAALKKLEGVYSSKQDDQYQQDQQQQQQQKEGMIHNSLPSSQMNAEVLGEQSAAQLDGQLLQREAVPMPWQATIDEHIDSALEQLRASGLVPHQQQRADVDEFVPLSGAYSLQLAEDELDYSTKKRLAIQLAQVEVLVKHLS